MPKLSPARRVASRAELTRPGDYFRSTQSGDVWFILPTADPRYPLYRDHRSRAAWLTTEHNGVHRIAQPPWTFRECEDGSLEVQPSIGCNKLDGTPGYYWHGYLDAGNVWRQIDV